MADADVPAIGKVNKPTLAIAGVAGFAAVVYVVIKHNKDKAAATATTASSAAYGYGSAAGYGYGLAGYGYGAELEAEEQAIAAQDAYGTYGYGAYGYGGGGGSTTPVTTPPSSNAQWASYAQTFLVSQGYNAATVQSALQAYITGQDVGANESIVEAAIAFEGNPPVAGANGYPPSINTGGVNVSGAGTGTGSTTGGGTPHPNSQVGSVYSNTTKETGQVATTDGGKTWKYIGAAPKKGQPQNQTGTVTSQTTGLTGKVSTSNAGVLWTYVG